MVLSHALLGHMNCVAVEISAAHCAGRRDGEGW